MSRYWKERQQLRRETGDLYTQVYNHQLTVDEAVQRQMMMMDMLAPTAVDEKLSAGVHANGRWSMGTVVKETVSFPFRLAGKTLKFMFNAAVLVLIFMAMCVVVFIFLKVMWMVFSPFAPAIWKPIVDKLF